MTEENKPETKAEETPEEKPKETSKETIELKAQKVLRGEYGIGPKRKKALGKDHAAVIKRVQAILRQNGTK